MRSANTSVSVASCWRAAHINGAFLCARLVDEVSLLLVPGIDGRTGVPAVFDGLAGKSLFPLRLKSVDQRGGTLWIRYDVTRSGEEP
jgi:2,5-diamino-6-(ribosylamino)-4(3H)-pyrimidinone 5'-phosphate reductase